MCVPLLRYNTAMLLLQKFCSKEDSLPLSNPNLTSTEKIEKKKSSKRKLKKCRAKVCISPAIEFGGLANILKLLENPPQVSGLCSHIPSPTQRTMRIRRTDLSITSPTIKPLEPTTSTTTL